MRYGVRKNMGKIENYIVNFSKKSNVATYVKRLNTKNIANIMEHKRYCIIKQKKIKMALRKYLNSLSLHLTLFLFWVVALILDHFYFWIMVHHFLLISSIRFNSLLNLFTQFTYVFICYQISTFTLKHKLFFHCCYPEG